MCPMVPITHIILKVYLDKLRYITCQNMILVNNYLACRVKILIIPERCSLLLLAGMVIRHGIWRQEINGVLRNGLL